MIFILCKPIKLLYKQGKSAVNLLALFLAQ